MNMSVQDQLSPHDPNCKPTVGRKRTSTHATTDLVTERWVIQRVQLVGDVFANEVPKHLIEKSIRLQKVGEPLSGPTQKLAAFFCYNCHLKKIKPNI